MLAATLASISSESPIAWRTTIAYWMWVIREALDAGHLPPSSKALDWKCQLEELFRMYEAPSPCCACSACVRGFWPILAHIAADPREGDEVFEGQSA